jgi:corrinoid protein of di/trimethylamine methyltransferase
MKEALFQMLTDAVLNGDANLAIEASNKVLEEQIDAYEAIIKGCAQAMQIAGEKFERNEIYIPELLISARAMNAAIDVLKPYITTDVRADSGKIIVGVVEGDIHDIGKNLVKLMLEVSGFEVIDLGRDVPADRFIENAIEADADVIGLSALMTTSMESMKEVVKNAKERGIRAKIMVGGAPVSQKFADEINADGYAPDAVSAARLAKQMIEVNG